jgi:hypothetical protein
MKLVGIVLTGAACALALAASSGCGKKDGAAPGGGTPGGQQTTSTQDKDHAHGTGPHKGTVFDLGGGKYHGEFTVDHKKKETTIYILKADAKTAAPIKADKLLLKIKEPAFIVDLKASRDEKDPEGMSSRFVGNHEKLGLVQEFAGEVTVMIDGKQYVGDFKEEPEKKE